MSATFAPAMRKVEKVQPAEDHPQILRAAFGEEAALALSGRFPVNAGCTVSVYSASGHGLPAGGTGSLRLLFLGAEEGCVIQVLLINAEEGDEDGPGRNAIVLSFTPEFTRLYGADRLMAHPLFRRDGSSEHTFTITAYLRGQLAGLQEITVADDAILRAFSNTAAAVSILRGAMESATAAFTPCAVPACRFLAYDSEREKIFRAQAILDASFEEGVSIKDLARRVAMNECYLKKGFKMLTGQTVHEYQSNLRIEAARRMLGNGQPVTVVAETLGYSSISHFSTAFKKATGLKPCELLK